MSRTTRRSQTAKSTKAATPRVRIPAHVALRLGRASLQLTNLDKIFWPQRGFTKRDLLQYYADVSHFLLPHLLDRAMVMKRYPNGINGKCFFMKRAPDPRPEWIETCQIRHKSENVIAFPMAQDFLSLLWIVNLGCIDLNQWYSRCDDTDRPDHLHFDLDPVEGTALRQVRETALIVRDALAGLGMTPLVKTSGSSGLHIYVPIVRGPVQKDVWRFAKALALELAMRHPALITAAYRIADRPKGRVLVDYNQNAWGRTLASVYSVRPNEQAAVSTPVTWDPGTRRPGRSHESSSRLSLRPHGSQIRDYPPDRRRVALRAQVGRLSPYRLPRRGCGTHSIEGREASGAILPRRSRDRRTTSAQTLRARR